MHYVHRPEVVEEPPEELEIIPGELPVRSAEPAPQRLEAYSPGAAPQREPVPNSSAPATRVCQTLMTPEQRPNPRADILSGYEIEPDRYVMFDHEELRSLQRKTSPTMEIVSSVKLTEIDPLFLETSYYVVPNSGGEKPHAILFTALRETGHVASLGSACMVGTLSSSCGPERAACLRTRFSTSMICSESEFRTDVTAVGAKELDLAKTSLDALEAPFAPEEFRDEYREELQAIIERKTAEAEVRSARQPAVATKPVLRSWRLSRRASPWRANPRSPPEKRRTASQRSKASGLREKLGTPYLSSPLFATALYGWSLRAGAR